MHKRLGFESERGEQRKFGGCCNWCWRFGDKEAQCLFRQEYMKSHPSQDPLQRDIREWSSTSEKGHSQPKGTGQAKARERENTQERETTTRTRLDLRMKMDSARWVISVKRQRFEFVGDVQKNDDFETPKLDRAACKAKF